jgi:hypothetical protein
MKFRVQILLIVILGLCCLASWNVYSQRRVSSEWQYKIVELERESAEPKINNLGAQGWELVSVQLKGESSRALYYLKRAK